MTKKLLVVLSFLLANSVCLAVTNFTSSDGNLTIPDVSVDGNKRYDLVTLQLNFSNGTFKVMNVVPKMAIPEIPLQTQTKENYKFDFLGCLKTELNQVTCYLDATLTSIYPPFRDEPMSRLYDGLLSASLAFLSDNSGRSYITSNITAFDKSIINAEFPLILEIPARIKYTFNDFDTRISSFSSFKPSFNGTYFGDLPERFQLDFKGTDFK